jgi:hypothetical protein
VGVKLDDTSSVRPKAKNASSSPIVLVSASAPWDDDRGRIAKFRGEQEVSRYRYSYIHTERRE